MGTSSRDVTKLSGTKNTQCSGLKKKLTIPTQNDASASLHLPSPQVSLQTKNAGPNKAKVIYVGRNVKDICVSGIYHSRPDIDFSKWAKAFKNGEVMVGNWFEHMREAFDMKGSPNFKSFWYEDMKNDFETVIKEVAAFLGKEIDESGVDKLVAFLNINKMRENPMVNKEWKNTEGGPIFMRKGIVGDWKTHFTSEESHDWDRWIESELQRTGIQGMRGWK